MNACDRNKSLFSDYLDKQLAPEQQAGFDAHLANCADCRVALQQVSFLNKRMQDMDMIHASADFDQTLRSKIISPVADSQKTGFARNLIIGTSSVAVFATLTFFAISTVNNPDAAPPQNTISRSTVNSNMPSVVKPQPDQPVLASEAQAKDSLSKSPTQLDPNKLKLVDQKNRQP